MFLDKKNLLDKFIMFPSSLRQFNRFAYHIYLVNLEYVYLMNMSQLKLYLFILQYWSQFETNYLEVRLQHLQDFQ